MQRRIGILAILLAWGLVAPLGASTFLAMDETGLVAASTAVVRGRVVSVESFWNDAHTLIVTEAVIDVESKIVGDAPRFLSVRTAGGTVDDFTVVAHGFPTFRDGERVLLFLQRDDRAPLGRVHEGGRPEGYRVTGYQLGHYRLVTNSRGQEIAVPTLDRDTRMLTRDGRAMEPPRARRADVFEAELRQIADRLRAQAGEN